MHRARTPSHTHLQGCVALGWLVVALQHRHDLQSKLEHCGLGPLQLCLGTLPLVLSCSKLPLEQPFLGRELKDLNLHLHDNLGRHVCERKMIRGFGNCGLDGGSEQPAVKSERERMWASRQSWWSCGSCVVLDEKVIGVACDLLVACRVTCAAGGSGAPPRTSVAMTPCAAVERALRLLLACRPSALSPLALNTRFGGRPHHARNTLGLQHLLGAGLKRP